MSVFFRFPPRRLLVLLGCVALALVGCGKKNKNPNAGNVVTGKVTCKGHPVPYGLVQFISTESGVPLGQGRINADGTYEVRNVPEGEVRVVVMTQMDAGGASGAPPMPAGPPGAPPRPGGGPPGPGGPGSSMGPPKLPPLMLGPRPPMSPEAGATLDEIQKTYGSPQKSRLSYTIVKGEQTHDIVLKIN